MAAPNPSPMAQNKKKTGAATKSSSKPNTPSNTATSPMAQSNASTTANTSTSPKLDASFHFMSPPKSKYKKTTKSSNSEIEPDTNTTKAQPVQNTDKMNKPSTPRLESNPNATKVQPVPDPSKPYRCVICGNEVVKAERERHFNGRPHAQTFGMLKDFKKRNILNKTLPAPTSKLLEVNKNAWRCPPCDASMPYPFKARVMQEHLAMPSHDLAVKGLWLAFVRRLRSRLGLRDDEIPGFPQGLDDTILQKSNETLV